jgi:hypothetical protein
MIDECTRLSAGVLIELLPPSGGSFVAVVVVVFQAHCPCRNNNRHPLKVQGWLSILSREKTLWKHR